MSIPLREGFVDESLERCLEDLLVRFVVNCPEEDLSSEERVLFQIEEAHWFYQDFLRTLNPLLPSMKMKQFTNKLIEQCPLIWKWGDPSEALAQFGKYKSTIPVRGCALLNSSMDKMLLVKGIESPSWGFPRGKISKGEKDVECALRELEEETGFDASDLIDEDEFVERTIKGKNYKIYIIKGVPDDTKFVPKVRYEIVDIKWMDIKFLTKAVKTTSNYYLVGSMLKSILSFIKRMKSSESEDELKRLATIQLKKILGINETAAEEEREDPGRALLSMLQAVAKNAQHISVNSGEVLQATQQPQQQLPPTSQQGQPQNPFYGMPLPPHLLQMQQNRMAQVPFQNPFALQMFNPLLFSNYTHSMPYPYLPQPISNPLASQGMAVVPSASSFSKPQFSLASKRADHTNSKELLSILKSKPQPKEDSKKSNSAELLSLLKKPAGPIKLLKRETPVSPEIAKKPIAEIKPQPVIPEPKLDITEPANNSTSRDVARPLSSGKPVVLLKKSDTPNLNQSNIFAKQPEPTVTESKPAPPQVAKIDVTEKRQNSATERTKIAVGSLSLLTNPNEKNNSDPSTQLLNILHRKEPVAETPANNVGLLASSSGDDKSKELLSLLKSSKPSSLISTPTRIASPSPQPAVNMSATNDLLNMLYKKPATPAPAQEPAPVEPTPAPSQPVASSASSALLDLLKRPSSSTATITTGNSSPMPQNFASPIGVPASLNGFNSFPQPQNPMQQQMQIPQIPQMHQMQQPQMQYPQMQMNMQQPMNMQQMNMQQVMQMQMQQQMQQQIQQQQSQTKNVSSSLLDILKGPNKSTAEQVTDYDITNNPIFNSFNSTISQQPISAIINTNTKSIQEFQDFEDFDDGEIEGEYINNGGLYDDED